MPVKAFNYEEDVVGQHDALPAGATRRSRFATRLADCFAKYRWCPNIIGPQSGGAVENLPLHQYEAMGEIQTKIPTEIMLTERREFELSRGGLHRPHVPQGLRQRRFFSANSAQKPKFFGQTRPRARRRRLNYRLGTQLPYMFIITPLAHYLKVLQREQIGCWKERADLERELNNWISQYVADMDDPAPAACVSRRPLREAQIMVEDVEGHAGWYRST